MRLGVFGESLLRVWKTLSVIVWIFINFFPYVTLDLQDMKANGELLLNTNRLN